MLGWFKRLRGSGSRVSQRAIAAQVRAADPDVRCRVAEQLGGITEPWACDELLVLLKDMMPEVRNAALDALRRQGPNATAALIQALEYADPKVAVPAANVLGELRDLDAVRPLLLVMKFGSPEIRAAATRALISYGRTAIPALALALQDPDPWTRTRGEEILAAIRESIRAQEASTPTPDSDKVG
ncbi:HEAT repeat protein [Gemmata sp. SH-PL17]|uniref:HEAT repeat domain-containing protein n=1 Tax=Gemmata sp. SH-PL17 TaxID=1630693 RepID=UPI00078C97F5|nr:HEAT repeat domain-containing protein [Gemmata sp. SH-PL17]AMV26423.1 HEAT repeat protein [Gemmata sp. SH-PL17]